MFCLLWLIISYIKLANWYCIKKIYINLLLKQYRQELGGFLI